MVHSHPIILSRMSEMPLFEKKEQGEKKRESALPSNIGAWQKVGFRAHTDSQIAHYGFWRETHAQIRI